MKSLYGKVVRRASVLLLPAFNGMRQENAMNTALRTARRPIPKLASLALVLLTLSPAGAAPQTVPGGAPAVPGAEHGSSLREQGQEMAPSPRLLVFLVVDQLRGDLLTRYASAFSGGFKRLLEDGLSFSNAFHGHAHTETSPGHAALSTGVFPARAGIPGNLWREQRGAERVPVYNVVDPDYALVGVPGLPGASPEVLRRKGLADWVMEKDPDARVLSISAKDRAAVLMAGKSRGEVYWFNSQAGRFVTSTFYRTENPAWLDEFNQTALPAFRADSVWSSTIPPQDRDLSAPDTADFEGDGVHTFFPHVYRQERIDPEIDDFFLWFEGTPMLDQATLMLAEVALGETGAGTREGHTDFISVSLSQTDRVGHAYGPLSREQMDNLLRLDRALAKFLAFLDEEVGRDNYVVGLSADHGIMTTPERLAEGGVRLTVQDRSLLERALTVAAQDAGRDPDVELSARMVEALGDVPFVGPAYTTKALREGTPVDSIEVFFRRSFVADRPGGLLSAYGVEMWWAEDVLDWTIATGSTHGSPYLYDRWVPLILMGPGIVPGVVDDIVIPVDLAPTLAILGDVPFPDDLDGKPLPLGGEVRSP